MPGATIIFQEREHYSRIRLKELSTRIAGAPQVQPLHGLTIFSAGSYARLEASEYSDIDMFFLYDGRRTDRHEPRTEDLRLFGALIEMVEQMGFPKFSNDCQYLTTLSGDEILEHLGSAQDDHLNLFTVRMLMLLESKCLYGEEAYAGILKKIIGSYYRDYPDHQGSFEPRFLLNDIGRFWKTLLLNYEHKRNQDRPGTDRTKQKVRNFKLKFSRMTTCFATIAALGSQSSPVQEGDVFNLIQLTPRERLQEVKVLRSDTTDAVDAVLEDYAWFLEQTGLSEPALYGRFEDKTIRTEMFNRANQYGNKMYELLATIERGASNDQPKFLRYLVI